jgi:hypothetical protein
MRKCDFYDDRARCRDVRRKLEFWLDPAVLHTLWDRTWNQWKHLLGAKIEVEGTFVQKGKFRKRRGEWELVTWETALPSRLEVKLPPDFHLQVKSAKTTYHRFGQYSRALDQIRLCLDHRAVERAELQRMCSEMRIPGDFDVAQISWRPDYDLFFYRQLLRRARRIYLFREEYIFDVEKAVVVETPQLGHATYVFAKPRNMDTFLALYTKITKDDIRRNRNNVAERLGFLGRVIHSTNPRAWLKEVKQRAGDPCTPTRFVPTIWYRRVCNWDLGGSGSTRSATHTVRGWTKPELPWVCSRSSCDTHTFPPRWTSMAMLRWKPSAKPIGLSCNDS